VDNFGTTGDTPSHPELLDHLAARFMKEGWSVKKLVRTLVLTRAYQLGPDAPETHRLADPANRLVWRHNPRRLDAEEIRDAMLASAGTLDPARPQGSPVQNLKMIELADNGAEARNIRAYADRSVQRSVYLPLIRGIAPASLEAFDPVEQTLVTGKRDATTVPGQALYLLNSPFVQKQSLALAERLLGDKDAGDVDRIHSAYRGMLGRPATEREVQRGQAFLTEYEAAYRATAPRASSAPGGKVAPAPTAPAGDEFSRNSATIVAGEAPRPRDPRTAAWMSFIQAMFGSAEFRFLR
jgi:hypothetical protein